MLSGLNLSRLAALGSTVAGAAVVFSHAVATAGTRSAVGACVVGLVAVWVHEEHATSRNADKAAATIAGGPQSPPPAPGELAALASQAAALLGGSAGPASSPMASTSTRPPAPPAA